MRNRDAWFILLVTSATVLLGLLWLSLDQLIYNDINDLPQRTTMVQRTVSHLL